MGSVLGVDTPLGEFTTPAITISVCTWTGTDSSLVLTLFPSPGGGLLVPYPDALALEGSEGVFVDQADKGVRVAFDADGTVIVLEGEAADTARLVELLAIVASRLPGAGS